MRNLLNKILGRIGDEAGEPEDREDALRLSTAVLLTEMRRADFEDDAAERVLMQRLLRERFSLGEDQAAELMLRSTSASDDSVSFFEFTRTLNENLSHAEKLGVIEMLWQIAYADGRLDKYEDYVVRKIADLMYVSHMELIGLKHKVSIANGFG